MRTSKLFALVLASPLFACGGPEEVLETSREELRIPPPCVDVGAAAVSGLAYYELLADPINDDAWALTVCRYDGSLVDTGHELFSSAGLSGIWATYRDEAQASLDAGGAVYAAFTLDRDAWSMNAAEGSFRGLVVLRDANGPICQKTTSGSSADGVAVADETLTVALPPGTDVASLELEFGGRSVASCAGDSTVDQAYAGVDIYRSPTVHFAR